MCKVKVYTTEIACKYMYGEDDKFIYKGVTVMGRIKAKTRRDKAATAHIAAELGIKPSDLVAYKECGYKIKESVYHVSWKDIKKYGTEMSDTVVIEG